MRSIKAVVMIFCFWGSLFAIGVEGEEIRMVHLGDSPWPPYTLGEVGQPATGGIAVELARKVYGALGIETRIELFPWKRVLKMAEFGKIDGPTLLMKTPERENYLAYTDAVLEARELLYYRTDRLGVFDWESFSDLKKYTIGLVAGYTYGDAFMKAIDEHGLKIERAVSSDVNFQKLYAGRIDLFLEDEVVAGAFFRTHDSWKEAFDFAANPVTVYDYYMAVSKKSPAIALLPELNQVIKKMKSDGSIKRLLMLSD